MKATKVRKNQSINKKTIFRETIIMHYDVTDTNSPDLAAAASSPSSGSCLPSRSRDSNFPLWRHTGFPKVRRTSRTIWRNLRGSRTWLKWWKSAGHFSGYHGLWGRPRPLWWSWSIRSGRKLFNKLFYIKKMYFRRST